MSKSRILCLMGLAACLLLSGCHRARNARSGAIRVSGAWALYPLMVRWAEVYQQAHPDVRVDVATGGAGKGVVDCASGLVDIGMLSRDARPEEIRQGILPLPVAKDAVVAVVSASNPLASQLVRQGLSRQALERLWLKDGAWNWDQVLPGGPHKAVRVYTRSDACGAAETWARYLGGRQEDLKGVAVYGDPGLGEAVRKDAQAIGYNNLNFAFDGATGRPAQGLIVVSLDANGNGAVDASEDISTRAKALAAIRSGAYPAPPARDLFLVLRPPLRPPVKAFLRWVLGDGQALVDGAGYVQVSEAQRRAALEALGR